METAVGMGFGNELAQSSSGQVNQLIFENSYSERNSESVEFASPDTPSTEVPPTTLTVEELDELLGSENNGASEYNGASDFNDFNPNVINVDDLENFTFNQPDSNEAAPNLNPLWSSVNVPANEDCEMTEIIANALLPINDGLSFVPEEMQEDDDFSPNLFPL